MPFLIKSYQKCPLSTWLTTLDGKLNHRAEVVLHFSIVKILFLPPFFAVLFGRNFTLSLYLISGNYASSPWRWLQKVNFKKYLELLYTGALSFLFIHLFFLYQYGLMHNIKSDSIFLMFHSCNFKATLLPFSLCFTSEGADKKFQNYSGSSGRFKLCKPQSQDKTLT